MLQKSTITLLRIPFSFFLMPIYFFALSQIPAVNLYRAILIFIIIHFIMYPASNGYNSYMDRDEESIGLLEKPPPATKELYYLSVVLDIISILLSMLVGVTFTLCVLATVLASRAYSYRGIRLKKYPITGFLTVVTFQGALTYYMVYIGASQYEVSVPWMGMLAGGLLFGGFYPLTQIYQHQQDLKDGVRTISYLLGYSGTFIFSGIMYTLAEVVLFKYFFSQNAIMHFWILQAFLLPILIYFLYWWSKVNKDNTLANFKYTMRMNIIASLSTNIAFILLCTLNHIFK